MGSFQERNQVFTEESIAFFMGHLIEDQVGHMVGNLKSSLSDDLTFVGLPCHAMEGGAKCFLPVQDCPEGAIETLILGRGGTMEVEAFNPRKDCLFHDPGEQNR